MVALLLPVTTVELYKGIFPLNLLDCKLSLIHSSTKQIAISPSYILVSLLQGDWEVTRIFVRIKFLTIQ
jgi:hypothetical protein